MQASKSQSVGFALQNFCRTVPQRCKTRKPRKTESLRSHAASKSPSLKSCFTEDFVSQPSFGEEKLELFVNNLRKLQKFKFFDRHMSIKFDYPSQSRAPFAGEQRFSKSRGLSASGSFVPLPHPLFRFFWLSPHFSHGKNTENPVLRSFFAPRPHGNACYAGYVLPYLLIVTQRKQTATISPSKKRTIYTRHYSSFIGYRKMSDISCLK